MMGFPVALLFLPLPLFPSPFQPLLVSPSTTYFILREGLGEGKGLWISQWRR